MCLLFQHPQVAGCWQYAHTINEPDSTSTCQDSSSQTRLCDKFSEFYFPLKSRPHFGIEISNDAEIKFVEDSLMLRVHYSNAKWLMYCFCCLDTVFYTENAINQMGFPLYKLFGEMELSLVGLGTSAYSRGNKIRPDYIFFIEPKNSEFYSDKIVKSYKGDSLYYTENIFFRLIYSFKYPKTALGFRVDDWTNYVTIYLDDKEYYKIYPCTCQIRKAYEIFNNPFQPEIIKYVRENAFKLNPWFLAEAKKRGMFDSVKYSDKWIKKSITIRQNQRKNCVDDYHSRR
jgi:hypothetical protein